MTALTFTEIDALNRENARRSEGLRAQFALDFNVSEYRWSAYNLMRLINVAARENPLHHVPILCRLFCTLGMGSEFGPRKTCRYYAQVQWGGVFDHGRMWGRHRQTLMVVGHPYGISEADHDALRSLALGFPNTLRVNVDDRPSYYTHGTNHVRIALVSPAN